MSAFTTVGPCWHVEDLGDEKGYYIYAAWLWSGSKLCGVAGGEGLEDLLASAATSEAKRAALSGVGEVPHVVRFRVVRVGPTPGAKTGEHGIEVIVRSDGKAGWEVDQMREVRRVAGKRKAKPKAKGKRR